MEEEETMFVICSSNDDCRDYDGCTYDYCDLETNLCNNNQTECGNCTMISVNIIPDNVGNFNYFGVDEISTNIIFYL